MSFRISDVTVPIFLLALLILLFLPVLWWRQRLVRRQRGLVRLLDLADDLEKLLNRAQQQMVAMQPLVERVPADIAAVANASLVHALPIKDAKRDLLQHRLWIQKNAETASQREIDQAGDALDRARQRIAQQLEQLEAAGADLAKATEAASEAAQREPPSLRRQPS